MVIVYHANPLRSSVLLTEGEKREFWLKLKVEHLEELLQTTHFHLEQGDTKRALQDCDNKQFYDETGNSVGKSPVDSYIDGMHASYLDALVGWHVGDCTCVAMSCSKCHAESVLGIDTLPGLGKHEANMIEGAFGVDGDDIESALESLRNYDPDARCMWKTEHPELFASAVPRWRQEAARAYKWLLEYRNENFPSNASAPADSRVAASPQSSESASE